MTDKPIATPREGGCQCGHIRYRIDSALSLVVCHCLDCQRQSSSAFGMSMAVSAPAFHLLSGTLKSFTVTTDAGRSKTCTFCGDCGSRIYHQTNPAALSIKAGTLDDTKDLNPTAHYWTKRKQTWVIIPNGVTTVEDDG
jgi:hypothetical protein